MVWAGDSAAVLASPIDKISLIPRVPTITADEAHLLRPTASDLLVFTPPLAPRPVTRLKGDGQIKNVFLSAPTSLPEGATSSKPIRPYQEPAVAVWVGEKKGAPASVALYPLSALLGKAQAANGDVEQTENRDFPMTLSRKAFYKADKLNVKWNNAGTMVGCLQRIGSSPTRPCSSLTPTSTTLASRTTVRPTSTSLVWTASLTAWSTSTRRAPSMTSTGTPTRASSPCATAVSCSGRWLLC